MGASLAVVGVRMGGIEGDCPIMGIVTRVNRHHLGQMIGFGGGRWGGKEGRRLITDISGGHGSIYRSKYDCRPIDLGQGICFEEGAKKGVMWARARAIDTHT